ncbi:WD40-repeat-containing domain protein [Mariannaea sp. PMI_226]|nr:WD40-repeat-containing domain protein [Mariannaea sp. PMI_226]
MTQPREVSLVRLARAFTQSPITALSFFRDGSYLLAGEDTHLAIYDVQRTRNVTRVPIFKAQPIHGIRSLNGRVLIWGASRIAVLSEEVVEGLTHGKTAGRDVGTHFIKTVTAPDWIYDAALSPFDSQSAVLVTAHNEIIPVHFDADTGTPILGVVVSPSRPILYAANVKWTSPDCVLVAGGTIFGEILMWKYQFGAAEPELISVLAGHEGSIFGVQISEDLQSPDGSVFRLLVSCSDDRTIRIWDITERQDEARRKHQLSAPRETGFGSTLSHEDDTNNIKNNQDAATESPIAVAMGHASRIWGVKLAPTSTDHKMMVYSFGEDSTAQRWRLDLSVAGSGDASGPNTQLSGVLKHQETYALHDGKHLWSHAVTTIGQQTLIATGGADSQISLITQPILSAETSNQHVMHEVSTLDIPAFLSSLPNPKALGRGREIVGRYDCISQTQILATSSLGRLMLGTFDQGLKWREIAVEDAVRPDVKACYSMTAIGDGVALLGSTTGRIYHFCESQGMLLVGTVPGKVVNILLLSGRGDSHKECVEVLVHIHGVSDAQYYSLNWRTGSVLAMTDVRGMDPRFVALSAARIKEDLIAIGSRHGWLSLLKRGEGGFRPVFDFASRSRDGITALVPLSSKDGDQKWSSYFLATSRDGKYRIYQIEEDEDQGVRLYLWNETSPPFGPFVEGGWFTQDSPPELILYGFRSHKMVVWNETRRQELAAIECGGSHRTFTFTHDPTNPHFFRFGFTKASQLFIYSQHGASHQSLKDGTHGREIRALSYNGRYLATCAEDTTIRIWEYEKGPQGRSSERELRCLTLMKLHISGIQQLQWLGDDYLLSSAGMEEFLVWRVRRLDDTSYGGLGVVCEAAFDDRSQDKDLRIMSFDAHKIASDSSIIITMALSNSTLKTYRYTADGSFHLLAKISYTGACLTQIRHLGVDRNGLSALTGSTDGHLATWEARFDNDRPVNHVLVHMAPLHQNSVKSLDLRPTPEGFQVLTGGDDNGLGISALTPLSNETNDQRYAVTSRGIVRKAHTAAINGVALTQRGTEILGVSVSNDQRLKVWRIEQEKVKLVADSYSGIADPGAVEVMKNDPDVDGDDEPRLVVGGVGIEVWNI